jgi:squalene-hopene/tetraprenyl-beta-curcumene cyclase
MRSRVAGLYLLLAGCVAGAAAWTARTVHGASVTAPVTGWNQQGAERFLDAREIWWQAWPRAQKDHGTVCVSCHTQLPYAMVRPGLSRAMGESGMTAAQTAMMASVEKRVNGWDEMVPFYSDEKNGPGKTVEAHNTEALLNAVILLSYDQGSGHLRLVTRKALENVWALQEMSGSLAGTWKWQNFHLGPWEGDESGYQGSALLLLEVMHAPDGYAQEPAARAHVEALRGYLRRGYAKQPLMNQLYVLWASGKDPQLLTAEERKALLATLRAQQQPDGGWRVMAMDERKRIDDSPEPKASDGMATGLAVLAVEESMSINKQRPPATDAFLFMTDAATAYAVMALEAAR